MGIADLRSLISDLGSPRGDQKKWPQASKSVFEDFFRVALNLNHSFEIRLRRPETCDGVFVGGYTRRVTPVPIPNTVVKPAGPMILLQRESRSLPAFSYGTPIVKSGRGSFLRGLGRGAIDHGGIR